MIQHLLNIDATISEVPNNTSITRCNKGNAMILERILLFITIAQYGVVIGTVDCGARTEWA